MAEATDRSGQTKVLAALTRIEAKLDSLIQALAEVDDDLDPPEVDLDGDPAGGPRGENTPL